MANKPYFPILCPDYMLTGRCNLSCKYCFEHNKDNKDMDRELLGEYLTRNPFISGFFFGGEPLLVYDTLIQILEAIKNSPNISKDRKQRTWNKCKNVITNGLLIPQLIDKIKEHDFKMQISVDGCKEAHDLNRVTSTGKGSWDKCMEAIKCCVENNVEWSVHGVITKSTLPYIFESFKWFFNIYKKYIKDGIKFAVDHLKHNTFQIIFEDNYTDDDVDIVIDQFGKIADWIWNHEEMTQEQKEKLFTNWFFKTGGTCGAGRSLLAMDEELNIYPCHRLVFFEQREDYCLGNVFEPEKFGKSKFNLYNAYHNLGGIKKYMYSAATQIDGYKKEDIEYNAWFMWCPATNQHQCGSPYFQPVKYNIMFTEVNRFIRALRLIYFGERRLNNSSNSSGNCS